MVQLRFLTVIIVAVLSLSTAVDAKKRSRSKKKFRATRFPATSSVYTKAASDYALTLQHKEFRYDWRFMREYRKMISSLLPKSIEYPQFGSESFLPLRREMKTTKSRSYRMNVKTVDCAALNKKTEWIALKTLQLEENNSVILKKDSKTGKKVVEKLMEGNKHYEKELAFFQHIPHDSTRYFPKLICASKGKRNGRSVIVTDFIDGDKSHVMAAKATWEQLRFMVAQFFNAVVEMHKIGFIHCDLTPANVMVANNFDVKLIDFGMAVPVGSAYGRRGSIYTRAPELHRMCPGAIDVPIDWWAFGATVSMWYFYHYNPKLITEKGDHLYHFTPMKFSKSKESFTAFEFPARFPDDLRKFLALFLTVDPELRTFSTIRLQNLIKSHEFFKGFNWCTVEKSC